MALLVMLLCGVVASAVTQVRRRRILLGVARELSSIDAATPLDLGAYVNKCVPNMEAVLQLLLAHVTQAHSSKACHDASACMAVH